MIEPLVLEDTTISVIRKAAVSINSAVLRWKLAQKYFVSAELEGCLEVKKTLLDSGAYISMISERALRLQQGKTPYISWTRNPAGQKGAAKAATTDSADEC